jgi:hypothetical protein
VSWRCHRRDRFHVESVVLVQPADVGDAQVRGLGSAMEAAVLIEGRSMLELSERYPRAEKVSLGNAESIGGRYRANRILMEYCGLQGT